MEGPNHQALVHGHCSKKRGPLIGKLEHCNSDGWWILQTQATLKPGDGLLFEAPATGPLEPPLEVGGRVMAGEQRSAARTPVAEPGHPADPGAQPCPVASLARPGRRAPEALGEWRRMP